MWNWKKFFRRIERTEHPPWVNYRRPLASMDYANILNRIVILERELNKRDDKLWWSRKERLYLLSQDFSSRKEVRNSLYILFTLLILVVAFK
jgi:hypothetical protein